MATSKLGDEEAQVLRERAARLRVGGVYRVSRAPDGRTPSNEGDIVELVGFDDRLVSDLIPGPGWTAYNRTRGCQEAYGPGFAASYLEAVATTAIDV